MPEPPAGKEGEGMIVRFPQELCSQPVEQTEPCLILILPVVRIERCGEAGGRRRRRRRRESPPEHCGEPDDALKVWLMEWAENAK